MQDMDMLEIGAQPSNFSWGGPGLTLSEARSHFTLWSVLKSPLLLGADASRMSAPILDILRNEFPDSARSRYGRSGPPPHRGGAPESSRKSGRPRSGRGV